MATTPVFMRLMASCVRVSEKAAEVVREILNSGDLGIVDKVSCNIKLNHCI